jgi:hypothetical protein
MIFACCLQSGGSLADACTDNNTRLDRGLWPASRSKGRPKRTQPLGLAFCCRISLPQHRAPAPFDLVEPMLSSRVAPKDRFIQTEVALCPSCSE